MSVNSRRPFSTPRGIRNNNPLNIRIGNVWLGEVDHPTDCEFEQFVSMAYGVRAAFVLLRRYIRHYHLDTIRKIVSRWAPRSENDTEAYITNVCRHMQLTAEDTIRYEDKPKMLKLVAAMAHQETGTWLDEKVILQGYQLA